MAIFHLSVKTFSRSSGQNAVAAAAYRAGAKYVDQKTGTVADYTRKRHVDATFTVCPGDVFTNPEELWNAAEAAEKRKNSTVAREYEIALPRELPPDVQEKMAREIARHISEKYGVAGQGSIHRTEGNPHLHLLTTTRVIGPDGFGAKTRILDDRKTGAAEIVAIKAFWAELCNRELKINNSPARVDHRSNADRGISALPTVHEGTSATALKKRHAYSARSSENARRKEINQMIAGARAEVALSGLILHAAEQRQPVLETAQEKAVEQPKRIFAEKLPPEKMAAEKPKKPETPKKPQKTAGREKIEIERDRLRTASLAAPWSWSDFDRATVETQLEQDIKRARTAATRAKKAADALRARHKIREFLGFPNSQTRAAIAKAQKLRAHAAALKTSLPKNVRDEIAARKSENKKWLEGEGRTLQSQVSRLDYLLNSDDPAIRRAVDAGDPLRAQSLVDRQNAAVKNQIRREIALEIRADQPVSAPTGPALTPEPAPDAPGF